MILKDKKYTAKIDEIVQDVTWLQYEIGNWAKKADFIVYYEDDLTNNAHVSEFYNQEKAKQLLALFGKKPQRLHFEVQGGLKKNKRPPNEEVIENWDDLIKELKYREINWYFEN